MSAIAELSGDAWAQYWQQHTAPYLAALSATDIATATHQTRWCFQLIDDSKTGRIAPRHFHSTFVDAAPELHAAQLQGAGVFCVVNATDGNGRGAQNILHARAAWADWDGGPVLPNLPSNCPSPSMLVRTARGLQPYWLFDDTLTTPEAGAALNRDIAIALESDIQACDAARVLRLPGFFHQKILANPLLIELEAPIPLRRYPFKLLRATFPVVSNPNKTADRQLFPAPSLSSEELTWAIEQSAKFLNSRPPAIEGAGGDHYTFETCARVQDFLPKLDCAKPLLLQWNARNQPPWKENELLEKWEHAARYRRDPPGKAVLEERIRVGLQQHRAALPLNVPSIRLSPDRMNMAKEAAAALHQFEPCLFQRQRQLICISKGHNSSPSLLPVSSHYLQGLMSRAAMWEKFEARSESWKPCHPPDWLPKLILDQAEQEWPFRQLTGIVECPTLRQNGTLLTRPGYDEATGLFFWTDGGTVFPELAPDPTHDDAAACLQFLSEPLTDFPFAEAHHRAAALAAILTALVRPAIRGAVPMFLFDASTPGAGKSKLANLVSLIALGRACNMMPQCGSEEEDRKRITSLVLAGDSLVCIDNITRPLGNGALDANLTAEVWTDRILGNSVRIQMPMRILWLVTGNNTEIRDDGTGRRIIPCRLAPAEERPDERTGFLHPDLDAWVLSRRGDLVGAGLTIVRAYCAAGYPDVGLTALGGFSDWDRLVRNSLRWSGAADCGLGREELKHSADPKLETWAEVLSYWHEAIQDPVDLHDLCRRVEESREPVLPPPEGLLWQPAAPNNVGANTIKRLREALLILAGTKEGHIDSHRLGYWCRHYRGRLIAGFRLVSEKWTRKRTRLWQVQAGPTVK